MYTNNLNKYLDNILGININESLRNRLDSYSKHIIVEVAASTEKILKPSSHVKRPKSKELPKDVKMPKGKDTSNQEADATAQPQAEFNPEAEVEKIKQSSAPDKPGLVKQWLKKRMLPWAIEKGAGSWGVMKNVLADLVDPELGLHRKTVSKWGKDIAGYLRSQDVVGKGASKLANSMRSSGEKPIAEFGMNPRVAKVILKFLASKLKLTTGKFKTYSGESNSPTENTVIESEIVPYEVITEMASHLYGYEAYQLLQEANEIDNWKYAATLGDQSGRQLLVILGDNFIKTKWVNPEVDKEQIIKWNQGTKEGANKKEALKAYKTALASELNSLVKDLNASVGGAEGNSSLKDLQKKVKEILGSQTVDIESWINKNKDGLNTSKEARKFLLIRGHATKTKEGKLNSVDATQKLSEAWNVDTLNKPTPHIRIVPKGKVFAYVNLYPEGTDVKVESIYDGESAGAETYDAGELTINLPQKLAQLDIEKLSEYIASEGVPTEDTSSESVNVGDSGVPEFGSKGGDKEEVTSKKLSPDEIKEMKSELEYDFESNNITDVIDFLGEGKRLEKIKNASREEDFDSLKNMGRQLAEWIEKNGKHISTKQLQQLMSELFEGMGFVKYINIYFTGAYGRYFQKLGGPLRAYAKKKLDKETYDQAFPIETFGDSVDKALSQVITEDEDDYDDDDDGDNDEDDIDDFGNPEDEEAYDAEINKLYNLDNLDAPAVSTPRADDDDRPEDEREEIAALLSPELDKALTKGQDHGITDFKEVEKKENFPILGRDKDWEYVSFNELFKYGRPNKTIAASLNKIFHDAVKEGYKFGNADQFVEYLLSRIGDPTEVKREKDSEGHHVYVRKVPQEKIDRLYFTVKRFEDSWFNKKEDKDYLDAPLYSGEKAGVPEEEDIPLNYDDSEEDIDNGEPESGAEQSIESEPEEPEIKPEEKKFDLSDSQKEYFAKAKANYVEKQGKMSDRDRELKPTAQKASDAAAKLGLNLSGVSDAKKRLAELKAKLAAKAGGEDIGQPVPQKTSEVATPKQEMPTPKQESPVIKPETAKSEEKSLSALQTRLAELKKRLNK